MQIVTIHNARNSKLRQSVYVFPLSYENHMRVLWRRVLTSQRPHERGHTQLDLFCLEVTRKYINCAKRDHASLNTC